MQSRCSFVIGRFQPLHDGHKAVIQSLLDEGRRVCVAVMDTEKDARNPYTVDARKAMLHRAFGDKIEVIAIPPVAEVCYGRNVGYHLRPIYLDEENISASAIRTGVPMRPFKPDREFLHKYRQISEKVHSISEPQGFWPNGSETDISYKLMHLVSEVSEAWEAARTDEPDKNISDMSGLEVQLADALGILMDLEVACGLHISEALLRKMEFNKTRGYLHDKKF
jgi:FAD synthase